MENSQKVNNQDGTIIQPSRVQDKSQNVPQIEKKAISETFMISRTFIDNRIFSINLIPLLSHEGYTLTTWL